MLVKKLKMKDSSYKEVFANSWKYNTSSRFQVDIVGSTYTLRAPIDKSNLKVGDTFHISEKRTASN